MAKRTVNDIGSRLRARREKRGLTLAELGERAGMTMAYVSMLELGARRSPRALLKLARELGVKVTVDDLLT